MTLKTLHHSYLVRVTRIYESSQTLHIHRTLHRGQSSLERAFRETAYHPQPDRTQFANSDALGGFSSFGGQNQGKSVETI